MIATAPVAMPLRFDDATGNLYNAEDIALARFRHNSQGHAVANACNSRDTLLEALQDLYDMAEAYVTQTGYRDPNNLAAMEKAAAALASVRS
jgi:hypothetical protein